MKNYTYNHEKHMNKLISKLSIRSFLTIKVIVYEDAPKNKKLVLKRKKKRLKTTINQVETKSGNIRN